MTRTVQRDLYAAFKAGALDFTHKGDHHMTATPYPTEGFFVAHKLFIGPSFARGGEWGDILDGPEADDERVVDLIIEAWKDEDFGPDTDDLRVWQIIPGKPAEDCTVWAVKAVIEQLEEQQ